MIIKKNMKILLFVAILILAIPLPLWSDEPEHKMIDLKFFKCDKSQSLRGGIYGKGPFKKFGPKESGCKGNDWVAIDKNEFKRLASEWYGFDWSKEIPFWQ